MNVIDLTIRNADPADADVIADFNARLAEESEGKKLAHDRLRHGVAAALGDPARARYFLACRGTAVVGQLMITTEWSDWRNGWFWWIQSVYVVPEERRRGVFRALYEHVEQLARGDGGIVGLRLYVEQENRRAQEVYRRLGMKPPGYFVLERSFEA